jgi:hypothetical protein
LRGLSLAALLLCLPGLLAAASPAQRDQALAESLRREGVVLAGRSVTLHVQRGALDARQQATFLQQLDRGVEVIRAHLGAQLDAPMGGRRIEVFVSADVHIAHVRGDVPPMVYLPAARVRNGKAPYLHELVHALASWSWKHAEWLGEGLAEHVAREVAPVSGGYHYSVMQAAQPERGPREHLASPQGQAILPLIGPPGRHGRLPPALQALSDQVRRHRRTHAPPFYLLATSYVDFLETRIGIAGIRRQAAEGAVGDATLRATWLARLQRPAQDAGPESASAASTSAARPLP